MISMTMPQPVKLRFSVDDYYKMIELGMLKDYEKAEIIEGELIKKIIVGDRHAAVVDRLTRICVRAVSDDILVRIQNPVRLSDFNEPEPDVLLADLTKYDGNRHPRPAEVLLLIEVSDSTLKYDRDTKLPLYADAEIGEVWIVNLVSDIVEVHTKPEFGVYQSVRIYRRYETVESESVSGLIIETNNILC
jgi:Putative restriction endonuclease